MLLVKLEINGREPIAMKPAKRCARGLKLTEGYEGLVDDFTLRRLPQASHGVQQDAPDAVNGALAEWMRARGLVAVGG